MAKEEHELTFCGLARKIGEKSTILFMTQLKVERDLDSVEESHVATIAGLEGRLVAVGATAGEAEDNAIDLFRDLVDDAIETSTIEKALEGTSIPFVVTQKPFAKAEEFFEDFSRFLNERLRELGSEDAESEAWLAVAK